MIRIRPYRASDAAEVISWCTEEKAFYQWTAGRMGTFPLTEQAFRSVEALMPFMAYDESGNVGFFTLRYPTESTEELRLGFIIVAPNARGCGCGRKMVRLGLQFAFELCAAERVTIGVFENNPAAIACYRAAGFHDPMPRRGETYRLMNDIWYCRELVIEREIFAADSCGEAK